MTIMLILCRVDQVCNMLATIAVDVEEKCRLAVNAAEIHALYIPALWIGIWRVLRREPKSTIGYLAGGALGRRLMYGSRCSPDVGCFAFRIQAIFELWPARQWYMP